jgi:hypothetical protein
MLFSVDGLATSHPIDRSARFASRAGALDFPRNARSGAVAVRCDNIVEHRSRKRNARVGAYHLDRFAPERSPVANGSARTCRDRWTDLAARMVDGG